MLQSQTYSQSKVNGGLHDYDQDSGISALRTRTKLRLMIVIESKNGLLSQQQFMITCNRQTTISTLH